MPVSGGGVLSGETASCARCHPAQGEAVAPGEARPDTDVPAHGVHGGLSCSGCHAGYSRQSHPREGIAGGHLGTEAPNGLCKRCHFDKYSKSLEGIHNEPSSRGLRGRPGCVDCHGSHRITSYRQDRRASAAKCGECHAAIYSSYASSVHGDALVNARNHDVPICIDCHRVHNTGDPQTVDYRNDIPFMCGNCHANEAIVGKYGLSTDVVKRSVGFSWIDGQHLPGAGRRRRSAEPADRGLHRLPWDSSHQVHVHDEHGRSEGAAAWEMPAMP